MTKDFEELYNLRAEVSEGIFECKILFEKIYEYEENREIMALTEIGKKLCLEARNNCEKMEFKIEEIENGLQ